MGLFAIIKRCIKEKVDPFEEVDRLQLELDKKNMHLVGLLETHYKAVDVMTANQKMVFNMMQDTFGAAPPSHVLNEQWEKLDNMLQEMKSDIANSTAKETGSGVSNE